MANDRLRKREDILKLLYNLKSTESCILKKIKDKKNSLIEENENTNILIETSKLQLDKITKERECLSNGLPQALDYFRFYRENELLQRYFRLLNIDFDPSNAEKIVEEEKETNFLADKLDNEINELVNDIQRLEDKIKNIEIEIVEQDEKIGDYEHERKGLSELIEMALKGNETISRDYVQGILTKISAFSPIDGLSEEEIKVAAVAIMFSDLKGDGLSLIEFNDKVSKGEINYDYISYHIEDVREIFAKNTLENKIEEKEENEINAAPALEIENDNVGIFSDENEEERNAQIDSVYANEVEFITPITVPKKPERTIYMIKEPVIVEKVENEEPIEERTTYMIAAPKEKDVEDSIEERISFMTPIKDEEIEQIIEQNYITEETTTINEVPEEPNETTFEPIEERISFMAPIKDEEIEQIIEQNHVTEETTAINEVPEEPNEENVEEEPKEEIKVEEIDLSLNSEDRKEEIFDEDELVSNPLIEDLEKELKEANRIEDFLLSKGIDINKFISKEEVLNNINEENKSLIEKNIEEIKALGGSLEKIYYSSDGDMLITDKELSNKINYLRSIGTKDETIEIMLNDVTTCKTFLNRNYDNFVKLIDELYKNGTEKISSDNYQRIGERNITVQTNIRILAENDIEIDEKEKLYYNDCLDTKTEKVKQVIEMLKDYMVSIYRKNGKPELGVFWNSPNEVAGIIDLLIEIGEEELITFAPEVLALDPTALISRIMFCRENAVDYKEVGEETTYEGFLYKIGMFEKEFPGAKVESSSNYKETEENFVRIAGRYTDTVAEFIRYIEEYDENMVTPIYYHKTATQNVPICQTVEYFVENNGIASSAIEELESVSEKVNDRVIKINGSTYSYYKICKNIVKICNIALNKNVDLDNKAKEIIIAAIADGSLKNEEEIEALVELFLNNDKSMGGKSR